jgi:hypothetical protein
MPHADAEVVVRARMDTPASAERARIEVRVFMGVSCGVRGLIEAGGGFFLHALDPQGA